MTVSENEEARQSADQITRPGAVLVTETVRAERAGPEPVDDEDIRREPGCSS
jgi:hypothetical protein